LGTVAVEELTNAECTAGAFTTCLVTPLPDKLTCCGLSGLLSLMDTLALRPPIALGTNFKVIVHDAPAPTLVPHVLV